MGCIALIVHDTIEIVPLSHHYLTSTSGNIKKQLGYQLLITVIIMQQFLIKHFLNMSNFINTNTEVLSVKSKETWTNDLRFLSLY